MNERIRELAIQSMLVTREDDKLVTGWVVYADLTEEIEKFAELIVRECTRAIINDRRLNDVRSAANGCVRTINEHFGVEE